MRHAAPSLCPSSSYTGLDENAPSIRSMGLTSVAMLPLLFTAATGIQNR
jgi:hypothetical protein